MLKDYESETVEQLLIAAQSGHYPLFHHEWIREIKIQEEKLSFIDAMENVLKNIKKINHHRGIERKKLALEGYNLQDRNTFINSYLKMVEYHTLNDLKELH